MPTEGNNEGTPIRSAAEIAMAGQRPMDSTPPIETSNNTPIQTALEKAMAGERPPISHNPMQEEVLPWVSSQGNSQNPIELGKYEESMTHTTEEVKNNWDQTMSNTPSVIVATEKKAEQPTTPVAEEPKRDLHQEALDRNKKANEGFIPMKPNPEITKALHVQDMIAELAKENARLKEQKELTPEQKQIQELRDIVIIQSQQIEMLVTVIQQNSITINGGAPATTSQPVVETPQPAVETPRPVTNINPELAPTTAAEAAERRDSRRKLKVAYIAGAVVGGSTGILGGVPAAGIGALACIAGGLLNTGLTKLSESNIERWNRRLGTVTDPAERTKLEKRVANWTKVNNFCQTSVKDFLRGARHGLLASSIFSGVFLGGHGLAWNTPEAVSPISNPAAGGNQGNPVGTGGTETGAGSSPETYQGNDFIDKNGQIHANGSPWDSKYVAGPEGNLPGGAENASNYVEGPWGRTPSVVDNFLKQNNVTDTSFLDGYDRDRILDETWLAIKNGNVNPDMTEILKHINTEGTNKLLSTIGQ